MRYEYCTMTDKRIGQERANDRERERNKTEAIDFQLSAFGSSDIISIEVLAIHQISFSTSF